MKKEEDILLSFAQNIDREYTFEVPTFYVLEQSINKKKMNTPLKVKRMQRSGTEAIRTQLQPSKPKREITNITNS